MAGGIAERVFSLVKDTVEANGVRLWDVKFLKEGASWYLRIFIDSDDGININNCTDVSHAIDPILDEADPIDRSYYLEVCSPGLSRELTRPEHFVQMVGKPVRIRLYHADKNGKKELSGILQGRSDYGVLSVLIDGNISEINKGDYAKVILDDEENFISEDER